MAYEHLSEQEYERLMKLDWGGPVDPFSLLFAGFGFRLDEPSYPLVSCAADGELIVARWYSAGPRPKLHPTVLRQLVREAIILAPHYEFFAWFKRASDAPVSDDVKRVAAVTQETK